MPCDPNDVFLEQPGPVLEPANGMQVELICRVNEMYRTVWSIYLPFWNVTRLTSNKRLNDFIATHCGIITMVSNRVDREKPLTINATVENSGSTVQCLAIGPIPFSPYYCRGEVLTVTFFGKKNTVIETAPTTRKLNFHSWFARGSCSSSLELMYAEGSTQGGPVVTTTQLCLTISAILYPHMYKYPLATIARA